MALFGPRLFEFIPSWPRALFFRWAVFVCGSLPQINTPLGLFLCCPPLTFPAHSSTSLLAHCQPAESRGSYPKDKLSPNGVQKWQAGLHRLQHSSYLLPRRTPRTETQAQTRPMNTIVRGRRVDSNVTPCLLLTGLPLCLSGFSSFSG